MSAQLLAAYDRPVPRYTSYPTAAQFSAAVGAAQHAEWLRDLDQASTCLYVHVPFCRELCWYCACHTQAMNRPGTLDAYTIALIAELELVARQAPATLIDGIQWGGGTPSQLGAARLQTIGSRIAALFDRGSDAEISLEIDPRLCDQAIAEAVAAIGVNRVSLGIQDFDLNVQEAINRRQSFEETASSIDRLRKVGIRRFNVDLVYGLPRQSLRTLASTLDQALALSPDRFAVFGYAHVPWMKAHQRLIEESALPGTEARAAMNELVREKMAAAGYRQVGLDHYARPDDKLARAAADGTLQRTFQGYVSDRCSSVVGVGASAISSLPGGFSQNLSDVNQYMARIAEGRFATARGVSLTRDDRLRGAIIERVMCEHAVDVPALCAHHRVDPEAFLSCIDLETLERDGLLERDENRLVVTEKGKPFVRFICAAFDRYYTGADGRHSRGI
jgi:oxygen-independent coproporphyrinogen III oxidase